MGPETCLGIRPARAQPRRWDGRARPAPLDVTAQGRSSLLERGVRLGWGLQISTTYACSGCYGAFTPLRSARWTTPAPHRPAGMSVPGPWREISLTGGAQRVGFEGSRG